MDLATYIAPNLTFFFMKTSTTLTILGVYQTLIGCVAMFGASSMAEMALAESYQRRRQP